MPRAVTPKITRLFAGSYEVHLGGKLIASIESPKVAERPAGEWLVQYYEHSAGVPSAYDGDVFPTMREAKRFVFAPSYWKGFEP